MVLYQQLLVLWLWVGLEETPIKSLPQTPSAVTPVSNINNHKLLKIMTSASPDLKDFVHFSDWILLIIKRAGSKIQWPNNSVAAINSRLANWLKNVRYTVTLYYNRVKKHIYSGTTLQDIEEEDNAMYRKMRTQSKRGTWGKMCHIIITISRCTFFFFLSQTFWYKQLLPKRFKNIAVVRGMQWSKFYLIIFNMFI